MTTPNDTTGRSPALSRRRVLGLTAAAAGIGVAAKVGLAPSADAQALRPTFGRFAYGGNPAAAGAERWAWQSLQAGLPRPSRTAVPQQYRYATAVYRESDPAGLTQCLPPSQVRPEWGLRSSAGSYITRVRNGDYLLDIGNPDFRNAAASYLVDRCRAEGWTGIDLDEANADPRFGFPGPLPAKYPTPAAFQAATAGFVRVLAQRLGAAGFPLVTNVAEFRPEYEAFNVSLLDAGARIRSEGFLTGFDGRGAATGGEWEYQVAAAEYLLGRLPQVMIHELSSDPDRIAYSLGTAMLVDNGRLVYGSSANTFYVAELTPYPPAYGAVRSLGAPTGARYQQTAGLWVRPFQNGTLVVNSTTATRSAAGFTFAPASARIV